MTPKERSAMQQALEALKKAREMIGYPANMVLYDEELALREALEQPEQRKWVEPSDELLNDILMKYTKTELYKDDLGAFRAVLRLAKELNA